MGEPDMTWLRLTPRQARVFLSAWSFRTVVCGGRDLNSAHRLHHTGLLDFIGPIEGGMKGEFALSEVGRLYPPVGLKALHVKSDERTALSAAKEPSHD